MANCCLRVGPVASGVRAQLGLALSRAPFAFTLQQGYASTPAAFFRTLRTASSPHCLSATAAPTPDHLPFTCAGFWYFLLPVYMFLKNLVWPRSGPLADKF